MIGVLLGIVLCLFVIAFLGVSAVDARADVRRARETRRQDRDRLVVRYGALR